MPLHRRWPLFARPLPFAAGVFLLLLGLYKGLNWSWDWSLQTGNVFIQILIPTQLLVFTGLHGLFLGVGLLGLGVLTFLGFQSRRAVEQRVAGGLGLWDARFRFFPLTLLLGLFLLYFGIVFLFDASVAADASRGDFVAFVYLNYAGIVHRPVVSIIGFTILGGGLALSTFFALQPGLGVLGSKRPQTATAPAALASATIVRSPSHPVVAPARPRPAVVVRPGAGGNKSARSASAAPSSSR